MRTVKLQYNRGARVFLVTIPKAIVELKGWVKEPEPDGEAEGPRVAPEKETPILCIEDDPETGGIRIYIPTEDRRKLTARSLAEV